jgi:adenylyl-sulfate kinase
MKSHKGVTLWFTGLSGSGKTTVALEIEKKLKKMDINVQRLDGDIVREYLTRDLGFSKEDRDENIRRNSYVAFLLTRNGIITLCSFISPYRKAREEARILIKDFIEIYVNAPLSVCEKRDIKGLYEKARAGVVPAFTGISDIYEPPVNPEIELKTDRETVEESAVKVINYLRYKGYISSGYADLHLHTTASDGTLTPTEVVQNAQDYGFGTIAITDHDSICGIEEAVKAGNSLGIEVIPGIELSALEGKKEIHILGYFIDPTSTSLHEILSKLINARKNRARKMIGKLNDLGIDISIARVREIAGGPFFGRPHIAIAMQEKGYIKEISDAFTTDFIGRGGRAYVERFKLTPPQAIELIQKAKGIPVLAHPGYLSDRTSLNDEDIVRYTAMGIEGVEVYYSKHTLHQIEYYKKIALNYNLQVTGGSDCHGQKELLIGSVNLPYEYVEELKKCISLKNHLKRG